MPNKIVKKVIGLGTDAEAKHARPVMVRRWGKTKVYGVASVPSEHKGPVKYDPTELERKNQKD